MCLRWQHNLLFQALPLLGILVGTVSILCIGIDRYIAYKHPVWLVLQTYRDSSLCSGTTINRRVLTSLLTLWRVQVTLLP